MVSCKLTRSARWCAAKHSTTRLRPTSRLGLATLLLQRASLRRRHLGSARNHGFTTQHVRRVIRPVRSSELWTAEKQWSDLRWDIARRGSCLRFSRAITAKVETTRFRRWTLFNIARTTPSGDLLPCYMPWPTAVERARLADVDRVTRPHGYESWLCSRMSLPACAGIAVPPPFLVAILVPEQRGCSSARWCCARSRGVVVRRDIYNGRLVRCMSLGGYTTVSATTIHWGYSPDKRPLSDDPKLSTTLHYAISTVGGCR